MNNNYLKIGILSLLFPILLVHCRPHVQEIEEIKEDEVSQKLLKVNQYLSAKHQDQIEAFVDRVGWEMEISPTGLWYNIVKTADGKQIRKDSRVTYSFASLLLDGTPCYSAGRDNPKTIITGQGGVESGVEEVLLKMSEGDSATLIIPPHLGHGNFGDRNKIPGNSVIIYKLNIIKVE